MSAREDSGHDTYICTVLVALPCLFISLITIFAKMYRSIMHTVAIVLVTSYDISWD